MEYWTLARSIFLAKEKWHGKVARLPISIVDFELTFIDYLDQDYMSICWRDLLYSYATRLLLYQ